MGTLRLRLPESLHNKLRELAQREGTSINQLNSTAVAEKIAALPTEDYLEQRATRGSRERFDRVLSKIRDVAPEPEDQLPSLAGE